MFNREDKIKNTVYIEILSRIEILIDDQFQDKVNNHFLIFYTPVELLVRNQTVSAVGNQLWSQISDKVNDQLYFQIPKPNFSKLH